LLLDRERPGVQQRLLDRRMVEIAGLPPEEDVGGKGDDRGNRAEEFRPFGGQQITEGRQRGQRHHGIERGQETTYPSLVEPREAESAGVDLGLDDSRDQVARDHEEDVDSDEAAIDRGRLEMKRHHRQYGDGPQPVDVLPVVAFHNRRAALLSFARARVLGCDDIMP
jgi:hypothetical protein